MGHSLSKVVVELIVLESDTETAGVVAGDELVDGQFGADLARNLDAVVEAAYAFTQKLDEGVVVAVLAGLLAFLLLASFGSGLGVDKVLFHHLAEGAFVGSVSWFSSNGDGGSSANSSPFITSCGVKVGNCKFGWVLANCLCSSGVNGRILGTPFTMLIPQMTFAIAANSFREGIVERFPKNF